MKANHINKQKNFIKTHKGDTSGIGIHT